MMRSLLVAVALASGVTAVGCGSSAAPTVEAPKRSAKEAVSEARSLIDEAYRVLRDGDPLGARSLLAPDVFFLGPGPADVGLDRTATIELASSVIASRGKHKLRSFGLEVFGGPDGRTAYATDQIEYDGVAFAVTIIAAEIDGLWAFTTIEVTRALNRKRLDTAVAPAPLPRWKPSSDAAAAHTAAPKEISEALVLAAGDAELRLRQYGKGPDAAFVGPSPDDVLLGAKALGKKWKKRAPTWAADATIAGATPDGALVWVVATATLVEDRDRDRDRGRDRDRDRDRDRGRDRDRADAAPAAGPPRRLFAIYRDDGGDAGWDLALLHEAAIIAR